MLQISINGGQKGHFNLHLFIYVLFALIMCSTIGCHSVFDPSGWGYIKDKGSPDEIANWAIRQTDDRRISATHLALNDLKRDSWLPEQKLAAARAQNRIARKMIDGWPGLKRDYYTGRDGFGCDALVRSGFKHIGRNASKFPQLRQEFFEFKPAPSDACWQTWRQYGVDYGLLPLSETTTQ